MFNDMKDGFNEFDLSKFTFIPSFDMTLINSSDEQLELMKIDPDYDIFKDTDESENTKQFEIDY